MIEIIMNKLIYVNKKVIVIKYILNKKCYELMLKVFLSFKRMFYKL